MDVIEVSKSDTGLQLAELLQRAEAGEILVITRQGRPVAKLVPIVEAEQDRLIDRRAQIETLITHLREGAFKGGRVSDWSRDELYDRETDRW